MGSIELGTLNILTVPTIFILFFMIFLGEQVGWSPGRPAGVCGTVSSGLTMAATQTASLHLPDNKQSENWQFSPLARG